ncbi:hypothetical protein BJ508DRAFT_322715 [Ascobolus immersus RN42]|uniref:PBP domain-containing protein n=1 Tax=Ascobolus immersus RN42 TaxID=1160509 RepID=A0A3N4IM49_ASCIM|nr:hypothetical protein BJ508DRAFT_322715 [Ascobolus immersus RN42]
MHHELLGLFRTSSENVRISVTKSRHSPSFPRFSIAWYLTDTTVSIRALSIGLVDVAITYTPIAEKLAIDQGIAEPDGRYYIFRDHFLIVGPRSNPAKIVTSGENGSRDCCLGIFSRLHRAAEEAARPGWTGGSVRFLSRFDKSATNIKESELWLSIGQVPWATAVSTWYHSYISFPQQALRAAILLEEYTLTDLSTYLSLPAGFHDQVRIYKAGSDEADDPLLLPGHLLVGTKATNKEMAREFAEWVAGPLGQDVVAGFKKGGRQLYSPAPVGEKREVRDVRAKL